MLYLEQGVLAPTQGAPCSSGMESYPTPFSQVTGYPKGVASSSPEVMWT